jgi:hypothetical protein
LNVTNKLTKADLLQVSVDVTIDIFMHILLMNYFISIRCSCKMWSVVYNTMGVIHFTCKIHINTVLSIKNKINNETMMGGSNCKGPTWQEHFAEEWMNEEYEIPIMLNELMDGRTMQNAWKMKKEERNRITHDW